MPLKILTVIGARPQFIKASVVSNEIRQTNNIEEIVLHTGQHYDSNMSKVFFDELNIPHPHINLNIGSGNHGAQTAKMLMGIESSLLSKRPDLLMVYGDTNSTLAGALAASKLHIPVCHIEAGLRSFNRKMPEEINRVLTDHTSDLLFAPTTSAAQQLTLEGIDETKIVNSGDVMFDAMLHFKPLALEKSTILSQLRLDQGFVLATTHRAENTDNPSRLKRILDELLHLSKECKVILPIHPRTRNIVENLQLNTDSLIIIEPLGFLDMIALEDSANAIITDSGGLQKEAFFHNKPCITLRNETEWTELVESGWNTLYPPISENKPSLMEVLQQITSKTYKPKAISPYGDGKASTKIVQTMLNYNFST
jgi:UDP-GlcNAc3NAcA epimerase